MNTNLRFVSPLLWGRHHRLFQHNEATPKTHDEKTYFTLVVVSSGRPNH